MIRGRINQRGQARVVIEMLGRNGQFQPIEVVLDTGFGGNILLPPSIIQGLEVIWSAEVDARLASGQEIQLPSWRGAVLWHGRPRSILVLQADGEPLLGMNLLRGSRVTLDVQPDGNVVIEELSR